jgi:uncharacterized repeat protein (TIGR02543 family)
MMKTVFRKDGFHGMAVLYAAVVTLGLLFSGCEQPTDGGGSKPSQYTITFDSHDGSPIPPITANEGASVNKPTDPARNGYTFTGWYSAASGGTVYPWPHTLTGNVTMHARWQDNTQPPPTQYTITFDSHDGSVVPSITADAGTAVSKPTDPTRNGYTFTGWYSAASGGTVYPWPHSLTASITVHAQWTIASYSITYTLSGGTNNASNPANYTVESPAINLAAPGRTGYTFGGWYSDGGFTTAVTEIPVGSTGDKTFYAQWTAITYTVAYNANDGDGGSTASSTHTYGQAKNLTANGFTRTGYTFAGWAASAGGSVSYADGANIENLTTTNGATVDLFAQWTVVNYTITYNLAGGSNNVANPADYTITSLPLTLADPTRTGYTFGGWYSDSALTTVVTSIPAGSTGDKTFYAQWTAITYTVVYDKNAADASGAMASSAHTYDTAQALSDNAFTRTGYTFAEWTTYANGTGTSYTGGQGVSNLSSTQGATVTLYARWTAVTYTIIYNLNGGTNNATNPLSYTIESPGITLTAPAYTGNNFGGWYSDGGFTTAVTGILPGSTGDKTFYAKWNPGAPVQISLQPVSGDPPLVNTAIFVDEPASFSTGTGYTSWTWYWDGQAIGGEHAAAYTLAANSKPSGVYELSVEITTGTGETLSARCRVTIKAH